MTFCGCKSKAISDALSGRKQKRKIVVNLQPREPAPVAQIPTRTFALRKVDGSSL